MEISEKSMLKIKLKKLHEDAKMPFKATENSGCFDLFCLKSEHYINENATEYVVYHTGIALELSKGYDAIIIPRSSVRKTGMMMANSIGYIDNDYRGEIQVTFKVEPLMKNYANPYLKGDRVCQIRLIEQLDCQFEEVDELSDTERGEDGFGSTGK